ncbi:rhomboid-related protein 4-like isoform X2 [Scyliorhinus torazame]|uniref:rhomboid-related protein 4-like isoform X2 n=1 Tax=Scyliorhinus torazame TaxID=75743 RepID=UPI003B5A83FF
MEELLGSYIIFLILLFIETKGIPPITLAIIILNMFIFLAPEFNAGEVCLSVNTTFYACEWQRLLLAPLHHIDVDHLGFNMASLVWKGSKLERRVGSARFMFSILIFGLLTGVAYLSIKAALACLLTDRFNMDCAVGFSGILFALKVINNGHSTDGNIPGPFLIKRRDACWTELILIHMLSPRVPTRISTQISEAAAEMLTPQPPHPHLTPPPPHIPRGAADRRSAVQGHGPSPLSADKVTSDGLKMRNVRAGG